jgi:hypothetical protein
VDPTDSMVINLEKRFIRDKKLFLFNIYIYIITKSVRSLFLFYFFLFFFLGRFMKRVIYDQLS